MCEKILTLPKVCKPAYIHKKNLVVNVMDATFIESLEYSRAQIAERVVQSIGTATVKDISMRFNPSGKEGKMTATYS